MNKSVLKELCHHGDEFVFVEMQVRTGLGSKKGRGRSLLLR